MVKKSSRSSRVITSPLNEILSMTLIFLSLFLFLSLITYSPNDPSFFHSNNTNSTSNLIGIIGAYLSDIFFFVLGYSSYLLCFFLVYLSFKIYKDDIKAFSSNIQIGFLITLIALCCFLSINVQDQILLAGTGGLTGSLISAFLLKYLNLTGTILLIIFFIFAGFTLWFKLSWINIIDFSGEKILLFSRKIFSLLINNIVINKKMSNYDDNTAKMDSNDKGSISNIKIEPKITSLRSSDKIYKEKQISLFSNNEDIGLPPLDLFSEVDLDEEIYSDESLKARSKLLELKLQDYGVKANVVSVAQGPVVTLFELDLEAGIKGERITNLSKDIARALSVISVRVVENIPGKTTIGIEIPNDRRQTVHLSEIIKSTAFQNASSNISVALGKNISGNPVVIDLAKTPHLLVAGTTGSGKSVAINSMIVSMLYKSTSKDVRLILIDPKMLELGVYDDIPHLLTPVVTDMRLAANALTWCVGEMERRYDLLAEKGVRNIDSFNDNVETEDEKLPKIVIVIDEFADLFLVVGKKIEELIARLAQKARAAGIHLILATQRPSVDVITGLIKANIPSRISFKVSSKIDSRVVLDQVGSESLLGHGDMLYLETGKSILQRVHGTYVSDEDVNEIAKYLKSDKKVNYLEDVTSQNESENTFSTDTDDTEPLYNEAVEIVIESEKASISYLQRKLKIGYNRAARLIEKMEEVGIVSSVKSNGTRDVIINKEK
jgi:S-DNA-T family DNA segregation ATPase FtsK/SpoIIIE|tara:strand:+ start:1424 stop:3583 length:2160 start_codon:yes stop_codon:yes gene_type:complete